MTGFRQSGNGRKCRTAQSGKSALRSDASSAGRAGRFERKDAGSRDSGAIGATEDAAIEPPGAGGRLKASLRSALQSGSTAAPRPSRGGRPQRLVVAVTSIGRPGRASTPEWVIEVLHGLVVRGAPRHRVARFVRAERGGRRGGGPAPCRPERIASHVRKSAPRTGGCRRESTSRQCPPPVRPRQTFGQASCGLRESAVHSEDPLMGRGAKYLLGRRPFRVES